MAPVADASGLVGLRARSAGAGSSRRPCVFRSDVSTTVRRVRSGNPAERAGRFPESRSRILYVRRQYLVQPHETSKGANVLEKGSSVGDSQFKLQVDGDAGRPGCVIVGTHSATIFVALASRSVADGRWHTVVCLRGNSLLKVAVDGAEAGSGDLPSSLSIVNSDPLCIGGKGTSANNDQFVGVIDDVFVTRVA